MSIGSKESDEVADEVGDGHNQLKELIEGQHLQNIKRCTDKCETLNFQIKTPSNMDVSNTVGCKSVCLCLCVLAFLLQISFFPVAAAFRVIESKCNSLWQTKTKLQKWLNSLLCGHFGMLMLQNCWMGKNIVFFRVLLKCCDGLHNY